MFSELIEEVTDWSVLTESVGQYVAGLSFHSVIVTVMMVFLAVGAVDKAEGNRRGYGAAFDEGFEAMGPLAIAMVGVITAPVGGLVGGLVMNLSTGYHMDLVTMLFSLLPVILVAGVLAAGLWFKPIALMNGFSRFGTFVTGLIAIFVAGVNAEMIVPMIFAKLACGLIALFLANLLAPQLLAKAEGARQESETVPAKAG